MRLPHETKMSVVGYDYDLTIEEKVKHIIF